MDSQRAHLCRLARRARVVAGQAAAAELSTEPQIRLGTDDVTPPHDDSEALLLMILQYARTVLRYDVLFDPYLEQPATEPDEVGGHEASVGSVGAGGAVSSVSAHAGSALTVTADAGGETAVPGAGGRAGAGGGVDTSGSTAAAGMAGGTGGVGGARKKAAPKPLGKVWGRK